MKPGRDLFDLIRSMSASEKGYFKKYASRHLAGGNSDYLRLFDAVDRQQEYDEAAIRTQVAGTPVARRIAATKHYLYALILESMRAYRDGATAERTILGLLADVEFLWEKGLHGQCIKRLARAKHLAVVHELFPLLIHIIEAEKRLRGNAPDPGPHPTGDALHAELLAVLRQVENSAEYRHVNYRLSRLIGRKGTLSQADDEELGTIAEHPLLQDEEKAESVRARISFHQTLWLYHQFATEDLEQSYRHNRRILELLESYPDFAVERPAMLITAVCQYLVRCILLGREEEYRANVHRLDALPGLIGNRMTELMRLHLTVESINVRMLFLIRSRKGGGDAATVDAIEADVRAVVDRLDADTRMVLCFNMAILCFYSGRFGRSLDWLNTVLHDGNPVRTDAYCAARLFSLVVHVELNNRELLEHAVKSVYRYLVRQDRLGRAEEVVLRFLRRIPAVDTERRLKEELVRLRDELRALAAAGDESMLLAMFDIVGWLNSRISGTPFSAVRSGA